MWHITVIRKYTLLVYDFFVATTNLSVSYRHNYIDHPAYLVKQLSGLILITTRFYLPSILKDVVAGRN